MKTTPSLVLIFAVALCVDVVFPVAALPADAPAPTTGGAAPAEPAAPPSAPAKLSAAELEKLAMPIALHPDPLIASILPAAAYPVEIVQAARFVKDTNNIAKVDEQPWDENVKAVAKFPELIAKMDADLQWTIRLGEAFVEQPKELMDTIQSLRAKAHKAGTLQSTPQQIVTVTNMVVQQTNLTQVVTVTNQVVQVQPSNPQVVYVPSYPPTVYYPPPAYNPVAPLVTFGVGMAWGAILANNCNWGYGHVDVDIDRNVNRNVNRNNNANRGNQAGTTGARGSQQAWKPDQNRRTSGPSASTRDARGWGSGQGSAGARPSTGTAGARPSTGTAGTRPSTGTAAQRPSTGTANSRPSAGASAGNRASAPSTGSRGSSGGSAFGGTSSGAGARSSASRGAASRGGGGGGLRGGGGGRGGGGRGR